MSLFNTRQGPRSGSVTAPSGGPDRSERMKALRKNISEAKLPPKPEVGLAAAPAPASPPPQRDAQDMAPAENGTTLSLTPADRVDPAPGDAKTDALRAALSFGQLTYGAELDEEPVDEEPVQGWRSRSTEPQAEEPPAPQAEIAAAMEPLQTPAPDVEPVPSPAPAAEAAPWDNPMAAPGLHVSDDPDADLAAALAAEEDDDEDYEEDPIPTYPVPGVLEGEGTEVDFMPVVPDADPESAEPAPYSGRGRRRANNNRTRLLGFDHSEGSKGDLFAALDEAGQADLPSAVDTGRARFPVGWVVVVDGPGAGYSFTLFNGVSQIGRGEEQRIRLDFGDASISRENHAAIAYDDEDHSLTLAQGGKANLVRLNGRPVLSNETLSDGDLVKIGTTTLRIVQLCTETFNWDGIAEGDGHADPAL